MLHFTRLVLVASVATAAACGGRPTAVSPAEIPDLEARLAQEPNNGPLVLRYSAALFAAGRCDTAATTARSGMRLSPAAALGPLVLGQCLERSGDADQAVTVYRAFLTNNPDAPGSPAVRAREMLAVRARSTQRARQALQQESQLASQPADPATVAVLPLQITGDSSYQPLSRGLAQILTSDLALLQRFRMVERLQLNALLDEIRFAQGSRVDPATAARLGSLVRAGRMVQGLATIPDERNVRLEASVVLGTGEVTGPEAADGSLRDLLQMEKTIVVGLASRLGYTLSEAERRAILENGTQNLAAFLAYSRGLVAEDLGDFNAAATYYAQAVRQDPGFRAARSGREAAGAATGAQQSSAGDVTMAAVQTVAPTTPGFGDPLASAVGSTIGDLAPTQTEQIVSTQTVTQAVTTTASTPPPPSVVPPTPVVIGTIRIVFRLP
jgi:tetratricopeptide (TPR) repeat protein